MPAKKKKPTTTATPAAKPRKKSASGTASTKKAAAAKKPAAKKAAAKKAPAKKTASKTSAVKKAALPPPKPVLPPLLQRILDILADKKAESVVVLDMRKLSSVTDFYVIASGNSGPQLRAMSEDLAFRLKKEGRPVHRRAGSPESQWMVLDYLDVIVHVMSPESRAYYAIEELWNDAPRIAQG